MWSGLALSCKSFLLGSLILSGLIFPVQAAPTLASSQTTAVASGVNSTADANASATNSTSSGSESNIMIGSSSNDPIVARLLPDYVMDYNRAKKVVALRKSDGSAKAFVQILPAAAHLSTTKAYAQDVMDSYSGWGLTAQVVRRGFSFHYVDNAPCAALLSYFDGTSYLLFSACGFISADEMTKAFAIGRKQLGIDNTLYRTSSPAVYY